MYKLFTKILAVFKNKKSQEHGENQDKSSSMGIKSIASDLFTSKSILSKMVLVFLIIIPVSTIGFITTTTASKSMIKSAEDSITSTTQQTSDYFDIYLEKAQDMSMQIIANSIIQDYLNMKTDGISVLDVVNAQNKAIEALNSINNTSVDITAKIMSSEGKALGELSSPRY